MAKRRNGLFADQSRMSKNGWVHLIKHFWNPSKKFPFIKCFSFILSAFESKLKKLHSYKNSPIPPKKRNSGWLMEINKKKSPQIITVILVIKSWQNYQCCETHISNISQKSFRLSVLTKVYLQRWIAIVLRVEFENLVSHIW